MSPWRELFVTTWQNLKADVRRLLLIVLRWVSQTSDGLMMRLDPPQVCIDIDESPELQAAKLLTVQWENLLGPGYGDAKRRQVFAALQKQFPELRKRAISQAIEDALP